jgi:uncharacterized protein
MTFVDTTFFLAISQPRDALHRRARAWADRLTGPFVVTEYVLCETVNALSKPVDRARAHALVGHVLTAAAYRVIPSSQALFAAGLQLHSQRSDKEWSLTDCLSFEVMTREGVGRALTHDHHFEQAGFEALLRRDPP